MLPGNIFVYRVLKNFTETREIVPGMGPIFVDNPASLRIMGKVVMVIRQMQGALGAA